MSTIKSFLKSNFPALRSVLNIIRRQRYRFGSKEYQFGRIHKNNLWGSAESISGPGSTLAHTQAIRKELPSIVKQIEAISFLDVPCGDFNWMKEVDLPVDCYIGGDIVESLVKENSSKYANDGRQFIKLDITSEDIPTVDLIFCRDCLVHLSYRDIVRALRNFKKSNSKYLLTTTFPSTEENEDIYTGEWRPLNLQKSPFCFPAPISVIDESVSSDWRTKNKSMALWDLSALPL